MTAVIGPDAHARAALARRSLSAFAALMDPRFETPPPHLRLIMDELDAIERGESRWLMISVPPRHAKTTISSRLFPAYLIGRNPKREIVLASHSTGLAEENSRLARQHVESAEWPFPNVRLARDSTAATRWHVESGGSVRALGVGSHIRGRGIDVGLLDDTLNDAYSLAECETATRWFTDQVVTRINASGSIVVIGQRLSSNDLCGAILESEIGKRFRVINLPALAEEDDPLGRPVGMPLWPEVFSAEELETRRSAMGTKAFETQFQGHPTPAGGLTFREEWFRRYPGGIPKPILVSSVDRTSAWGTATVSTQRAVHVLTAVDAASKTGTSNDWSVIATLATDMRDIFIVDVVRKRVEFVDLCHEIEDAANRWNSKRVYIESASSGIAAEQALRAHTRLNVIPIVAEKSKQARAEAVTPIFEAGRVHVPERAAWLDIFLTEFLAFPAVRHDDQVDAVVLGINALGQIVESERESRRYQSRWRGIGR